MESQQIKIAGVAFGAGAPLGLIAGPCVIESLDSSLRHAAAIREIEVFDAQQALVVTPRERADDPAAAPSGVIKHGRESTEADG